MAGCVGVPTGVVRTSRVGIREFLRAPAQVTGKGVRIAVVDGGFPAHPDIASDGCRDVFLVSDDAGRSAAAGGSLPGSVAQPFSRTPGCGGGRRFGNAGGCPLRRRRARSGPVPGGCMRGCRKRQVQRPGVALAKLGTPSHSRGRHGYLWRPSLPPAIRRTTRALRAGSRGWRGTEARTFRHAFAFPHGVLLGGAR